MQKKDRLAAGYTLEKYERIYRQAFYDAAKKADPNWEIGKPIKDGALDIVTRELAESRVKMSLFISMRNLLFVFRFCYDGFFVSGNYCF